MSEWLGKMLGKVRIDSLLARGGIAEVYLGEHVALQREVAVKILRNQYEDDTELLERFQREARVVAKLRHSNIVQVFDFDSTTDNRPYLVMEYVPGISLSRYLHVLHGRNGRLELPVISRIITQVAHALQYAHESGVIHRDVKPGNILLTSRTEKVMAGKPLPGDFEPILTDFGLVRFLNSSRQTTTGVIAGTPAYMSPEQARGEPADERTDIYSLGIVLYELLAGHIPFDGETTMSIILKHVTEPPPPIPGIPYELQYVLNRALAKKPEDRFQTTNDLANAFAASIKGMGDSDTIMETSPRETTHITTIGYKEKPKQQRRWAPFLLAGTVVALFSGFLFFRDTFSPSAPTPTQLSPTQSLAVAATVVESTPTPPPIPPGVIHFQDGTSILDQDSIKALAMVVPPDGSHYEFWFSGGREWKSFGILLINVNGTGELISKEATGLNLLSLYDQAYVTLELNSDLDAKPSNLIAYSSVLPAEGLTHLRQMLVSSSETPNGIALIQGLNSEIELIDQLARGMQSAYQRGNETSTRKNAEAILNLMAGDQSEFHKDWDGDGQVTDSGDGFGLLPNGVKLGYIQAISSHTDSTIHSLNATQHMIKHGEEVKICAKNLEDWTSQLRDLLMTIVTSAPDTNLSQPVLDSVNLADLLLNGVDTDDDKNIDAVAGECGMSSLYGYAYSMADMTLLPFDPSTLIATTTDTTTPTITPFGGGNSSGSGGKTPVPPNPTKKPPGKPPTNTPRPKKQP
jgi:serine/threonine protein kinase